MNKNTWWRVGAAAALAAGTGAIVVGVAGAGAEDPPDDLLGATAAVDGDGEQVEANDDGDVIKPQDEPAELIDADTDEVMFSLTVTDAQVRDFCPGRTDESVAPENGHFVVFTVDAAMDAGIVESSDNPDETFLPLLAEAFQITDSSGEQVLGGGTAASWLCFEPDELAPAFVGPGESATGLVVLDSSVETGFIRYAPDGQTGWVWEF